MINWFLSFVIGREDFPVCSSLLTTSLFFFQSLLRILKLRKYCGNVQFVPASGYETYGEPITQGFCSSDTELRKDDQGDTVNASSCGYQGLAVGADGCEWRCMNGPFIAVWINNVPWAGEDVMPAPNAKVVLLPSFCFFSFSTFFISIFSSLSSSIFLF